MQVVMVVRKQQKLNRSLSRLYSSRLDCAGVQLTCMSSIDFKLDFSTFGYDAMHDLFQSFPKRPILPTLTISLVFICPAKTQNFVVSATNRTNKRNATEKCWQQSVPFHFVAVPHTAHLGLTKRLADA